MKIGIVGSGVVGSAISHGFGRLGHSVKAHDVRLDTRIDVVRETEIVFVCVPTPQSEDGRADVSLVRAVIGQLLEEIDYQGIVAIKSTVEPGATEALIREHPGRRICFVPEFLRERCAIVDFMENHDVCIIGTNDDRIFEIVKRAHGHYPKCFVQLSPTEAEISKYYNNTYNAMLITFANAFYRICGKMGADYTAVKDAITKRMVAGSYLDCNSELRGFGGACLPKDTRAISAFAERAGLDMDILKAIISDNEKYPHSTP